MSFTPSDLKNEQDYMRMFFLGGSLKPQLDELEQSEEELLQQKKLNLDRQLLEIITESNRQADQALQEIDVVPFGKGDTDQISALKETIAKTKRVEVGLQGALSEHQAVSQKRIEERELLQRKLAEMQQLLRSKQANSFANQETLLNIGNSLSKYLGTQS